MKTLKNQSSVAEVEAKVAAISDVDLARLAVFIGSRWGMIKSNHSHIRPHSLMISIRHFDPRMIAWVHDLFDGEISESRRGLMYWKIYDGIAHALLKKCLPYFIVKRDQAEKAIAFWELKCGREQISDQVIQ